MIFSKCVQHIRPFAVIALMYYTAIFLLKLFDTFVLFSTSDIPTGLIWNAFMYNYIASSLFLVVLFFIYIVISIFSKKIATIATSVLASLFLIFEIATIVYVSKCETQLGSEVLYRPITEIIPAIIASVGTCFWIFSILSIGFVVLFPILNLKFEDKLPMGIVSIVLVATILGSIFFWKLPQWKQNLNSVQEENYVIHKLFYFVSDCKKTLFDNRNLYDESTLIPIDTKLLHEFVATFPNRHNPNNLYPLEHYSTDDKDVLSSYFENTQTLPNVVIIITESLGREWHKNFDADVSFTPFLDSLATQSLYWSNCLSTTNRSFGAMPAITGSLPFGIKGFQFGNMPNHNSLLTILKDNGYQTNAFYAGDFTFDAIQEYLTKQDIDYMSLNLRHEYNVKKIPKSGTYWGYDDEHLFQRSFEILNKRKKEPYCNIYTTISSHDNLTSENSMYDYFVQKTQENIDKLDKKTQKEISQYKKRLASLMYSDYAIQYFFQEYEKQPEYKNTIFIITGDHSSELHLKNQLGLYHVPLIIYSPLLKQTAEFNSIVSHLDITPSILQFLKNSYQIQVPSIVHWIGDGLDTSSHFVANKNLLFMDYAHDIDDILFGKYFYKKTKDAVFEIDETLNFTPIEDTSIKNDIEKKLEVFKYVNRYVYINNRISSLEKKDTKTFTLFQKEIPLLDCYPAEKAGIDYVRHYFLLPKQQFNSSESTKQISISCTAEINITGETPEEIGKETWIDRQMLLTFCCEEKSNAKQVFSDKIVKFAMEENVTTDKWYPINICKTFTVPSGTNIQLSLYVSTPTHYKYWTPNNHLRLRNIRITIEES